MRKQFGITRWSIIGGLFLVLYSSLYGYENFRVAVYCRAYEVNQMADPNWLASCWNELEKQVHVDKVYLETHRDRLLVGAGTIQNARQFFESRNIETAGGITLTVNERNRFQTFCYSNPEQRRAVREIAKFTAGLFDEVILDDFFFTNCKCPLCIQAKGNQSWTQFRLNLLEEAGRELIINPAKAVNPKVKMVIKYPNWYEHFQGLGFDLKRGPKNFDGIYTGTETRDSVRSQQHLQPYLGYLIFRYFENIKPGGNGGGWVDTGGMTYMDRYAEQLWLTLFAKAPEITLFDIRQITRPIQGSNRAPWQDGQTSFDFAKMSEPIPQPDGTVKTPDMIARAAGYTFETVDRFLGKLGKPIGVKSYKPWYSTGEDFLHTYLGMTGIPIDLVSEFPSDADTILLTECAKFDAAIVDKVKTQLLKGKTVVITSGLLRALQGKGIEDIVELQYTDRKALIQDFVIGRDVYPSDSKMLIPQIQYLTNDSWEEISCLDAGIGYPILHQADYAEGHLYVLTIPDNFADLYNLPPEVLTRIKEIVTQDLPVRIESRSQAALFLYDNNTCIVESFLPEPAEIRIAVDPQFSKLRDVLSGEEITLTAALQDRNQRWFAHRDNRSGCRMTIKPHSYRVLRFE